MQRWYFDVRRWPLRETGAAFVVYTTYYPSHEACLREQTIVCQGRGGSSSDWICYYNPDGSKNCVAWP